MQKTVLILGASGKIGRHASRAFEGKGWQVHHFDRAQGQMVEAAQGAQVIVNGLNPPRYHDWSRLVPAITQQVIEAAKSSGATVIVPGNVYNFGDAPGEWSETTPQRPTTRKGRIRVAMESAYANAGIQTIVLRAGNFIEPQGKDDVMQLLYLKNLERGRLTVAGDPNALQAYCYLPDWASAAVALAEQREALASFEDIPFPGHAFTAEELRCWLSAELDRPIQFARFPWWALTLLSPLWELAREMLEMRYLWDTPHALSATKFAHVLPGFEPTPLDEVLRQALPPVLTPQHQSHPPPSFSATTPGAV